MPEKSQEQNHNSGKNFGIDVCSILKQAYLGASSSLKVIGTMTSLSLRIYHNNIGPFLLTTTRKLTAFYCHEFDQTVPT